MWFSFCVWHLAARVHCLAPTLESGCGVLVTDLGPLSAVCGLGLNLFGYGSRIWGLFGCGFGVSGLVCGVHVHFYKFIVVGYKSMPRGVPRLGCGEEGNFSANTSILIQNNGCEHRRVVKKLSIVTGEVWSSTLCIDSIVLLLSHVASGLWGGPEVRQPRGKLPLPLCCSGLLRPPRLFISSFLGCICTWRSENWKRSPSEIRLGEHRKGLWWCHHNRLDYYYF